MPLGIGDDAAVVTTPQGTCVVSTDMLMEGVDFLIAPAAEPHPGIPAVGGRLIGRKAVAVNLSDMAAMAARPTAIFASLALPQARGTAFAHELMDGIREAAEEWDVVLAGGDTNSWQGPCVVSLTVLGDITSGRAVLRSGGRVGDWLFVTGALGGSLSGRQFHFRPRVAEAILLHQTVELRAMLDLSDGLAGDVRHLFATESPGPRGALFDAASIPIHSDVPEQQTADERLRQALTDGEDFELLFAVSPTEGQRLVAQSPFETPVTKIGELTATPGLVLRESTGTQRELPWQGWTHRW